MERKLTALVIGNSDYPDGAKLKNPANDAEDLSRALIDLGFSVVKLLNASNEEFERSLNSFEDNLNSNSVGLFYFAGHGMQIHNENYLNAIDSNFDDEISAKYSSFPLNRIIDIMNKCSNLTNIIILDACRNNPFVRSWKRGADQRGLAPVYTPRGTIIGFATSPGETAADGRNRNGSYTESLLRHIKTRDIAIEELFKRVRNTLGSISGGTQTSWEHTSLSGDFFFNISTGKSIIIYDKNAISDKFYQYASNCPIREIAMGLKSYNWYTQNAKFSSLNKDLIGLSDSDSLFVLGRNIYQAACGDAKSCNAYISQFHQNMEGVTSEKIKNILDGMLFEVFF